MWCWLRQNLSCRAGSGRGALPFERRFRPRRDRNGSELLIWSTPTPRFGQTQASLLVTCLMSISGEKAGGPFLLGTHICVRFSSKSLPDMLVPRRKKAATNYLPTSSLFRNQCFKQFDKAFLKHASETMQGKNWGMILLKLGNDHVCTRSAQHPSC